jgi:hypothetical protein
MAGARKGGSRRAALIDWAMNPAEMLTQDTIM